MNNCHLFLDIGNTAIDCLYINSNESSGKYEKYPLLKKDTLRGSILKHYNEEPFDVYISSVNLKASAFIRSILDDSQIKYYFLDSRKMVEFSNKYGYTISNISFLGSDLFCDIIAEKNDSGLIIIDLGTATKVLYLDQNNVFHGCSILPGIMSFPKALFNDTSLLGDYPLIENPPIVSLETEECISSGAIYGTCYAVTGLVLKLLEKNADAKIYLTGGNSYLIEKHLKIKDKDIIKEPYLVLKGIIKTFGFDEVKEIKNS